MAITFTDYNWKMCCMKEFVSNVTKLKKNGIEKTKKKWILHMVVFQESYNKLYPNKQILIDENIAESFIFFKTDPRKFIIAIFWSLPWC